MGIGYSRLVNSNNNNNNNNNNNKNINENINVDNKNFTNIYEYLVFSGGSTKAIAYCGALLSLDNLGILYDKDNNLKIKGIAGASAGSIVAILLAIGYKPIEILNLLKTLDLEKIFTDGLWLVEDAYNIFNSYGFCKGEYLLDFFGNLIKDKTGNIDYTFEDLLRDKNIKLITVTSNINCSMSVYMYAGNPIKEYSNVPLRIALRMSVGLPLIFEPFLYNGDYFVDGGVLDNYPIHVFDGAYPGDPEARLNLCEPNYKVLGIKILPNTETLNYTLSPRCEIKTKYDYVASYINTFLIENDRRIMTPSFWQRSIPIMTPNYPMNKFNLTDKEKEDLIELGKQSTVGFFIKIK